MENCFPYRLVELPWIAHRSYLEQQEDSTLGVEVSFHCLELLQHIAQVLSNMFGRNPVWRADVSINDASQARVLEVNFCEAGGGYCYDLLEKQYQAHYRFQWPHVMDLALEDLNLALVTDFYTMHRAYIEHQYLQAMYPAFDFRDPKAHTWPGRLFCMYESPDFELFDYKLIWPVKKMMELESKTNLLAWSRERPDIFVKTVLAKDVEERDGWVFKPAWDEEGNRVDLGNWRTLDERTDVAQECWMPYSADGHRMIFGVFANGGLWIRRVWNSWLIGSTALWTPLVGSYRS
jgi:hypothetical protein